MKWIKELLEKVAQKVGRKGDDGPGPRNKGEDGPETPGGEVVKALVEAVGSQILSMGQWTIKQMKRTTGEGEPEKGERFGQGHKLFNSIDEKLGAAVPDDSWDGSGSHAYADQNSRQRLRSETMAEADRNVMRVLSQEAFQINYHRDKLDDQYNFLGEVSEYTQYLEYIPRYGEAAKIAFELAAVQAALSCSAYELYNLQNEVNQNAAQLQQLVGRYSGVADSAELSGAGFGGPPPPPGGGSPPRPPVKRAEREADTSPPTSPVPPLAPTQPTNTASPTSAPPPIGPPVPTAPSVGLPGGSTGGGGGGPAGGVGPTAPTPAATPSMPAMAAPPQSPAARSGAAPGSTSGAGPLGSIMGPLGGLLSGAGQAAGQLAASPPQPTAAGAAGPAAIDKNPNDEADKDKRAADKSKDEKDNDGAKDDTDSASARPGEGGSARAPIHIEMDIEPDQLHMPVTVTFDPDDPSGPPAPPTHRN